MAEDLHREIVQDMTERFGEAEVASEREARRICVTLLGVAYAGGIGVLGTLDKMGFI